MKLNFYDNFKCIADQCSLTCCQEWKIAVDEDTLTRWKNIKNEETGKMLDASVRDKDGAHIITLDEQKKCPFLNNEKLCKLVTGYGDGVLSKTCQDFPREIKKFSNRTEYSLMACCPTVIDLLQKQEEVTVQSWQPEWEKGNSATPKRDRFLFELRAHMMAVLQENEFSDEKALLLFFYLLLEIKEQTGGKEEKMDDALLSRYFDKENLKRLSETIDKMEFHESYTFTERNELFLDLIENYRKEGLYRSYLEHMAGVAEDISKKGENSRQSEALERKTVEFKKQFLPYKRLFHNYLIAEIFASTLLLDSTLDSVIISMEWIALEYVIMQQAIFLDYLAEDALSYERLRDIMAVVARMTGYDEEDILSYLTDSFASAIWDWGYFALMVGK